ncbi:CXXC-type zinc finger protein 1-like [Limulus polyphemus]|uniref:CXXC-type zinc finger protein 1 n=1 Tax=Limulus polyphemus TaxID=6850 RepID=A0ABM1RYL3_LIMPO|nr:CXXC-type zinc finger protein 1-like [Limulus polyphemus]
MTFKEVKERLKNKLLKQLEPTVQSVQHYFDLKDPFHPVSSVGMDDQENGAQDENAEDENSDGESDVIVWDYNSVNVDFPYYEVGLCEKEVVNRIYEILPHRIQQWQSTPCWAEESNQRTLERIRRDQQEARRILTELEKKEQELEELIKDAKKTSLAHDDESQEGDTDEGELSVYCVTCGHEIGARTALKHMEKCFNKVIRLH